MHEIEELTKDITRKIEKERTVDLVQTHYQVINVGVRSAVSDYPRSHFNSNKSDNRNYSCSSILYKAS